MGHIVEEMNMEDKVEVIRCKDCKYWENEEYQDGYCCESDSCHWDADDFCSRGEKKDATD